MSLLKINDNKKEVFKFQVSIPRRQDCDIDLVQRMSIIMSAPQFVFYYSYGTGDLDLELVKRVAMAELKLSMIEALLNGVWEIEK